MAMVEGLRHEQLMHWKQRWNSRRICSWRKTKRFNHVLMVSCHNPRDPDAVHAIPDLRFKVGTTHHFNHETWPVRNRQIFYKVQICPDSGSLFAFRVEWSNPQFRPVKLKRHQVAPFGSIVRSLSTKHGQRQRCPPNRLWSAHSETVLNLKHWAGPQEASVWNQLQASFILYIEKRGLTWQWTPSTDLHPVRLHPMPASTKPLRRQLRSTVPRSAHGTSPRHRRHPQKNGEVKFDMFLNRLKWY